MTQEDNGQKLIVRNRPKKTLETMLIQYQDRLNFWNEDFYEQSNPLARSGLFSISLGKTHIDDYEPVRVLGEGEILYRGHRLNVFDEEVFLQLLSYMRGLTLIKPLSIKKKQLLKDLGLNDSGKNYQRLTESLNRLDSGKLKIFSQAALNKLFVIMNDPNLAKTMEPEFVKLIAEKFGDLKIAIESALKNKQSFFVTIGFIQNNSENIANGNLLINIDPLIVLLFDGTNTTRTARFERKMLCPAEKRLLTFVMSHSLPIYDMNLVSYRELLGSESKQSSMRKFRADLEKWLSNLEKIGRIESGWQVTTSKVTGVKSKPYN